jgi:uncharacterized protein YuzE
MGETEAEKILRIVPEILEIPSSQIWIDHDSEADVLYINFKKPAHADESIMSDDDIIYRYEGDNLVGITILSVRKRLQH